MVAEGKHCEMEEDDPADEASQAVIDACTNLCADIADCVGFYANKDDHCHILSEIDSVEEKDGYVSCIGDMVGATDAPATDAPVVEGDPNCYVTEEKWDHSSVINPDSLSQAEQDAIMALGFTETGPAHFGIPVSDAPTLAEVTTMCQAACDALPTCVVWDAKFETDDSKTQNCHLNSDAAADTEEKSDHIRSCTAETVADGTETCEDTMAQCDVVVDNGLCAHFLDECPESCGVCPEPAVTTTTTTTTTTPAPTSPSETCEDLLDTCEIVYDQGLCGSAGADESCPLTCGACPTAARAARALKMHSSKTANARLAEKFNVALQRKKSDSEEFDYARGAQQRLKSDSEEHDYVRAAQQRMKSDSEEHDYARASQRNTHPESLTRLMRELSEAVSMKDLERFLGGHEKHQDAARFGW